MNKRDLGKLGEDIATIYLKNNEYEILDRNYFYRHKEIDIIAKKRKMIIFVEVKLRTQDKYGEPSEAVTINKRKNIYIAAKGYISKKQWYYKPIRFDVIEIMIGKKHSYLKHIENYE